MLASDVSNRERRAAMAMLRRDRRIQFATKYHRNVRGEPLQFRDFFYMFDILSDPSPNVVIMSSVQTGKTEGFIASLMADTSLGLSCFYVLPTQDTRNVFVPNRIDRLFEMVPHYKHLAETSTGDADSVLLKHIGKGSVRFASSNAHAEFKEFPADVLYVDEYDICDPEGLAFAFDRTKASPYRFTQYLANPTYPGTEFRQNIDWLFQNSDAKRVHYKCSECGLVQWLDWKYNVVKPVHQGRVVVGYEPILKVGREVKVVCQKCGEPIDRSGDVVGWVPTGDKDHSVSGYQITRLNNPTDDVTELYDRFAMAVANETKMRVFYNSDMGVPYEGGVGNKLNADLVGNCCGGYDMPSSVRGPCTMGVDVGATLDVRISDYVTVEGRSVRRMVHVAKCAEIDEVIALGRRFKVAVAVIDAAPETRLSLNFQKRAPFRVWRCQYKPNEGKNVRSLTWNGNEGPNGEERYVSVDRTEAMDSVFQAYVRGDVLEPNGFETALGGKYLRELCAPVRDKDADGRPYWIKTVDHQFHAHVYDWVASQDPMGGFGMSREAFVRKPRLETGIGRDDYNAPAVLRNLKKHKGVLPWNEVY